MRKIFIILTISRLLLPLTSLAAAPQVYTGIITGILGFQLQFSTASGAYYSVQTQNTPLTTRYGSPMQVTEIITGDKIQVTGLVRPDNSIAASLVRDMSLYAHNGTFTGKIISLSPVSGYIVINSRQWGAQTINVSPATAIQKNSAGCTLADLTAGMTLKVKGSWERSNKNVTATSIQAIIRLVDIEITGHLMVRGQNALTVVGNNNAIYGISLAGTALFNKKNQPITVGQLGMDDILRVTGKHISGSTEIMASNIKDTVR
jgi:hypothetical protein